MEEEHCKTVTHDEALAWFKDEPFDFEPGTKWSYNNSGYYLLGIIIENITGKTYGEHMQETFFTPLGLDRTRFDSNVADRQPRGLCDGRRRDRQ
jgi:CubicO group peptidase (beta-lactamase class C family)